MNQLIKLLDQIAEITERVKEQQGSQPSKHIAQLIGVVQQWQQQKQQIVASTSNAQDQGKMLQKAEEQTRLLMIMNEQSRKEAADLQAFLINIKTTNKDLDERNRNLTKECEALQRQISSLDYSLKLKDQSIAQLSRNIKQQEVSHYEMIEQINAEHMSRQRDQDTKERDFQSQISRLHSEKAAIDSQFKELQATHTILVSQSTQQLSLAKAQYTKELDLLTAKADIVTRENYQLNTKVLDQATTITQLQTQLTYAEQSLAGAKTNYEARLQDLTQNIEEFKLQYTEDIQLKATQQREFVDQQLRQQNDGALGVLQHRIESLQELLAKKDKQLEEKAQTIQKLMLNRFFNEQHGQDKQESDPKPADGQQTLYFDQQRVNFLKDQISQYKAQIADLQRQLQQRIDSTSAEACAAQAKLMQAENAKLKAANAKLKTELDKVKFEFSACEHLFPARSFASESPPRRPMAPLQQNLTPRPKVISK